MTYLELVKGLLQETGTEPPDLVTDVTSLDTQHQKDAKNWIDRAYREIQLMHEDWEFRRGNLTVNLVAGTRSYALTSSAADYETLLPFEWPYNRPYAIIDDQRYYPCYYVPWPEWRGWFEAQSDHEGRPRYFTEDPSENLIVYPKPREAHTFACDYAKQVDTLTANSDTPIIPERFHETIVFFALVEYAGYDEASGQYQRGSRQLRRLMQKLKLDQLEQTDVSRA